MRFILANIGAGNLSLGNFEKATDYYQQALELLREVKDPKLESSIWLGLSVIYGNLGDPKRAIEAANKRFSWAESVGDKDEMFTPLINIANNYHRLGDYYREIETQTRALGLLKELGEKDPAILKSIRAAALFNSTGNAYSSLGYLEQPLEYYRKSQKIREELGNPDFGGLINIGNIFSRDGDYPQALEHYEKALKGFEIAPNKGGMATTLHSIGNVYLKLGDFQRALESHSKALSILEKGGLPSDAARLTVAYDQFLLGDFPAALTTAEAIAKRPQRDELDRGSASANLLVRNIYRSIGNLEKSDQYFEEAISITEKQRDRFAGNENVVLQTFQSPTSRYFELVKIRVDQDRPNEAFAFAESAKSRALLDVLVNGKYDISGSMNAVERSSEQKLKNAIISLNAQIASENRLSKKDSVRIAALQGEMKKKRGEFVDFQLRLFAAHPELRVQRGEMKPITLEETAALLPDDETAVAEYVVADDKTFLFVIIKDASQRSSLKAFTVDIKDIDLAKMVEAYRSKLASGDLDFQRQSRELYDLLLKPAQGQLAGKTNLIIVPDGPLWDLPFQALQNDKGRYLVEKPAVSYAPSLTALKEMSKKAKTRKPDAGLELLAFGNPIVGKATAERVQRVFMSEKLEPLPEAERLVNELGKMYGANRSKVYVGYQAREETAKAESPKYRIVQFATHGILNNVSPMYSHLVLAQNEKNPNEDGLLEAWEMKDLDLNADMVILSACETARGRISNGEGVIGMSWALFIAGTPTTVASQWKVESSSTTELMLEFHRQLLSKKPVSKAEALRRASLKLMKMPKYHHPSYWGGFVVVGGS